MDTPPLTSYYAPPHGDPGMMLEPRSSWPKVIGIIGIVFGSCAMVAGLINVLALPTMLQQFKSMGLGPEFVEKHSFALKILPGLGAGLGLLLLLGSILTLVRKRTSRAMLLGWAVLKIAFVVAQLPSASAMAKDMMPMQEKMMSDIFNKTGTKSAPVPAAAPEAPAAPAPAAPEVPAGAPSAPQMQNFMEAGMVIGQAVSVIWGCALPVFLLIWLMRRKIRVEVAGWGA